MGRRGRFKSAQRMRVIVYLLTRMRLPFAATSTARFELVSSAFQILHKDENIGHVAHVCVCAPVRRAYCWGGYWTETLTPSRPKSVLRYCLSFCCSCVRVCVHSSRKRTHTHRTHTHAVRKLDRIMHFNKIFRTLDAVPCTCYLDKEDEHSIKTEEQKIYVDISQTVPMPAITSGLISLDSCNRAQ